MRLRFELFYNLSLGSGSIWHLQFDRQGKLLLGCCGGDLFLWRFERASGFSVDFGSVGPYSVFSPDDTKVLSVSNYGFRILDVQNFDVLDCIELGYTPGKFSLSPDGTKVAVTMGIDSKGVEIRDLLTHECLCAINYKADNPAFSPDGNEIAVTIDYDLIVWNVKRNDVPVFTHKLGVYPMLVRYSCDGGKLFVYGVKYSIDNTSSSRHIVNILDAKTGKKLGALYHMYPIVDLVAIPGSDLIIAASNRQSFILWDIERFAKLRYAYFWDQIRSVAVSPDGAYIVVGGLGGCLGVWRIRCGY